MIQRRILSYIKKYHMITPGEICLVGLSGGADSVCLLLLLKELREELGCSLQAVHINHGIRGKEAERDAAYCRELCEENKIPYYEYFYDVPALAKQHRIGTEEMGRIVRKEAYRDCMNTHHASKLALAHHQNDVAETFLFHLARGTSLEGLAAIRPVREQVIRPLLCMNREEIVQYLKERQITFCEDSTNFEDEYTRNRIRHHVVSYLTKYVNPNTPVHISAVSEDLTEVCTYLEEEVQNLWNETVAHLPKKAGSGIELSGKLFQKPGFLKRKVLLMAMKELSGKQKDITREHLDAICRLWELQVGKKISLIYGIKAVRTYDTIRLLNGDCALTPDEDEKWESLPLELKADQTIRWNGLEIKTTVSECTGQEIVKKKYTKCFDYDTIKGNAVFRTRQTGDYLVNHALGGRKKLKDFMIDCKIPKEDRDHVLLLAKGSEILWVVGYRMGESAKIGPATKQMIKIQITGGDTDE